MATISKYTTKKGIRYRAEVLIRRKGEIIHRESRSFDRKRLAEDWAKERELEVQSPEGLKCIQFGGMTVGDVIDRYFEVYEPEGGFGRSKSADMKRLKKCPLADVVAVSIEVSDLVEHARFRKEEGAKPATINNDYVWLSTAFKGVRASDSVPLDLLVIDDARQVLRANKMISRPAQRDRRPTKQELWKLSRYFWRKQFRDSRSSIPMLHIMWFQIYSARRDAETCRLQWSDNNNEKRTGMVRDAKHPTRKEGNHRRFKYTDSAWKIVERQYKDGDLIFPYNPKSISAVFARACKLLGIKDLRLHDLRHEATSRLFEQGYSIEQVPLFTLHEDWKTLKRYTHLRPEDL